MSGYTWFDVVSGEFKPILGRATKVEMPACTAGHEFIVHRRPDRKTGWAVTHVETGAQAGKDASRQKAEADASQRMARHTEESFRRAVDAARLK